ncbi:uncharacterized protein [Antedon mediterranea]|uniref:uncharacterized protein n=1 Tax=Antedon mediterranea TaxID=105859 RepID=UPI003AF90D24
MEMTFQMDFYLDGTFFFYCDICALKGLALMLPFSNAHCTKKGKGKSKGASREESLDYLIQHQPIGTSVDTFAKNKSDKFTQPFLLALGPSTNPEQYFLVCDHCATEAGSAVVLAFDLVFKSFYTFNVFFPGCLYSFYRIIYYLFLHKM